MGTSTVISGARERRKQAAKNSIERIAVELALESGLEQLTIEAICERSLISPRTFYNYFPSKEAALFGAGPRPTEQDLEAFRTGTSNDIIGDLLDLLTKTAMSHATDADLLQGRRRLLRQHPALAIKGPPGFDALISELHDLTVDRLQHVGPPRPADPHDEAAMIVALAAAVMQRSMRALLEADDDANPNVVLRQSIDLARHILTQGRK